MSRFFPDFILEFRLVPVKWPLTKIILQHACKRPDINKREAILRLQMGVVNSPPQRHPALHPASVNAKTELFERLGKWFTSVDLYVRLSIDRSINQSIHQSISCLDMLKSLHLIPMRMRWGFFSVNAEDKYGVVCSYLSLSVISFYFSCLVCVWQDVCGTDSPNLILTDASEMLSLSLCFLEETVLLVF